MKTNLVLFTSVLLLVGCGTTTEEKNISDPIEINEKKEFTNNINVKSTNNKIIKYTDISELKKDILKEIDGQEIDKQEKDILKKDILIEIDEQQKDIFKKDNIDKNYNKDINISEEGIKVKKEENDNKFNLKEEITIIKELKKEETALKKSISDLEEAIEIEEIGIIEQEQKVSNLYKQNNPKKKDIKSTKKKATKK